MFSVPPMRPYTIAHDQQGAGLRDYIARVDVAVDRDPTLTWIALIVLAFAIGCVLGVHLG